MLRGMASDVDDAGGDCCSVSPSLFPVLLYALSGERRTCTRTLSLADDKVLHHVLGDHMAGRVRCYAHSLSLRHDWMGTVGPNCHRCVRESDIHDVDVRTYQLVKGSQSEKERSYSVTSQTNR
jgi:hypothetical protein